MVHFSTINAQLTHKQISAYIILVFCIASTMILNVFESLFIYLSTYAILLVGIYSTFQRIIMI